VLVSLEGVAELARLEETEAGLELGAGLTLSQLEAQLGGRAPLLETMLRTFAARQIRNRATLGGNLATASPVGDLAPVLLAGNAQLTLASPTGERQVALHDFFTGYRSTVRGRTELIKSVTLPSAPAGQLAAVYKVAKRGADDISTVAAAFCVRLEGGVVASARLAYGGVAATPVRALAVEDALRGRPWTAATAADAAGRLRELFTPLSDLRGSAAYRRALVGNLFEKFFHEHPHAPAEVAA
jgi:xanthine dehydrogenase small subunit